MNAVSPISEPPQSERGRNVVPQVRQGRMPFIVEQDAGVPLEYVQQQESSGAALRLACDASRLELGEIYRSLGISASHFSEMRNGKKHFPADKIRLLCEVLGNRIYPTWIGLQVGCELNPLQSETERENTELRAMLAETDSKLSLLMDVLKEKR